MANIDVSSLIFFTFKANSVSLSLTHALADSQKPCGTPERKQTITATHHFRQKHFKVDRFKYFSLKKL